MLARTSVNTKNADINKMEAKANAKILLNEFCLRHPDIKGAKRDQVKDIYFYYLKFGKENIPTDIMIMNEINYNIVTSAQKYEYKYLEMKQHGIVTIHWKDTDESITNIDISNFKNFKEFRAVFKGYVNEKELQKLYEEMKIEYERQQTMLSLLEDKEYEEFVIPKIKKN